MENALFRFLSKNTIQKAAEMPVFHSTSAYAAKRILQDGAIDPQRCDVFEGEEISYLFYGRPSYKKSGDNQISKYWQLPGVFIFDYDIASYSRVFPFDTGAFKAGLYPDFFNSMPMGEYEVAADRDAPRKLVSSFFIEPDRYFRLRPRQERDFEEQFELGVLDEEIRALHELSATYSERIDDRRFAIELQVTEKIELERGRCRAIILPEEYAESEALSNKLESLGIEFLTYPSFPLKQEMYYFAIYNVVYELYKAWGLAR